MLCLADDRPVAAPGVAVKFFDCLDDAVADGVEMKIANKDQKIVVLVAENGFIAVFEKMASPFVAAVVILGVPCEELAHDAGYAVLVAFEEDVDVIGHEYPGVD